MKKLILLAISLAAGAQAARLSCVQKDGWHTQGMYVNAAVSGEYQAISEDVVVFDNVSFEYAIYEEEILGEEYVWSKGRQSVQALANRPNYAPRKYKDHLQFRTYVNSADSTGYGQLDLIVPAKKLTKAQKAKFTGYLVMTWMDDHFGGTARLNCSID